MSEKIEITVDELTSWYRSNFSKYQSLADSVTATLVSLLSTKKIDFVAVSARVKTLESVLEKFSRKNYESIDDITDLLGIRIVLYIESDIERVSVVINNAFKSFPDLGVDKSEELAVDQIGYRCVHYICELGEQRFRLDELAQYSGVKFEIQVRTILQHAWAEIEHDRIYKFPGELPPGYRRRLNLLAGTLELVDREFSTIARDLDNHEKSNKIPHPNANENNHNLEALAVSQFLDGLIEENLINKKYKNQLVAPGVDELRKFGINDIKQLKELFSDDFIVAVKNTGGTSSKIGMLRKAMMYKDMEKYFSQAWPRTWRNFSDSSKDILIEKYGQKGVDKIGRIYFSKAEKK